MADTNNHRIEVISTAGNYVSSIGDASGPGHLVQPYGVGVSGTGLVYVADVTSGIKVFSTSGSYLETVATTVNGQAFAPFSVSVAPTGLVYAAGQYGSGYGAFRFFDPASWSSGTNTFTNPSAGPTSVAVGSGQLLGTNLTLDATKGLVVGQATTVNNGGSLVLAGGTLNTGTLVVDGGAGGANFTMTSGTLTTSSITVQNGGVADFVGQPLSVALASTVTVADAASQFKVEQGATLSATGLTNNGQVTVGPNADFIVFNSVVNPSVVNLNGGELDVRGLLGNAPTATIQGAGSLSTTAGLSNGGRVFFSGQATVLGAVDNLMSGNIEVSGGQSHTFSGNLINDGTFTVDPGSSATFLGSFSGRHGTVGTGTVTFAGGLAPGDPVDLAFGGNVVLGHNNSTTMLVGGTAPGTGYDKIDVAGQISVDGTLNVATTAGFTPQAGEVFHLFTWSSQIGTFSQLTLPAPAEGLWWDASQLYAQGACAFRSWGTSMVTASSTARISP